MQYFLFKIKERNYQKKYRSKNCDVAVKVQVQWVEQQCWRHWRKTIIKEDCEPGVYLRHGMEFSHVSHQCGSPRLDINSRVQPATDQADAHKSSAIFTYFSKSFQTK